MWTKTYAGYSIAEVGKIVLSQLIAKQCSATNIDVVGVSLFTYVSSAYQLIFYIPYILYVGCSWVG